MKPGRIEGFASLALFCGWFALFGAPLGWMKSVSFFLFPSLMASLIVANAVLVVMAAVKGSKWWFLALLLPLYEAFALVMALTPE